MAFENERRIEDEEEEEEVIYFLFISSHWSAKRLLTSFKPTFGIEYNQHKKKKKKKLAYLQLEKHVSLKKRY